MLDLKKDNWYIELTELHASQALEVIDYAYDRHPGGVTKSQFKGKKFVGCYNGKTFGWMSKDFLSKFGFCTEITYEAFARCKNTAKNTPKNPEHFYMSMKDLTKSQKDSLARYLRYIGKDALGGLVYTSSYISYTRLHVRSWEKPVWGHNPNDTVYLDGDCSLFTWDDFDHHFGNQLPSLNAKKESFDKDNWWMDINDLNKIDKQLLYLFFKEKTVNIGCKNHMEMFREVALYRLSNDLHFCSCNEPYWSIGKMNPGSGTMLNQITFEEFKSKVLGQEEAPIVDTDFQYLYPHLQTNYINSQNKTEEYNGKVIIPEKVTEVARGEVPRGTIVSGRERKIEISVGHLSNKASIGFG